MGGGGGGGGLCAASSRPPQAARAMTAAKAAANASSRKAIASAARVELIPHPVSQVGIEEHVDGGHGQGAGGVQEALVSGFAGGELAEVDGVDGHVRRGDGDGGVNGGDEGAYVAHVRRAHGAARFRVHHFPAQPLDVRLVGGGQRAVGAHRLLARLFAPAVLEGRGGSLGGALEAGQHLRLDLLVQVLVFFGAEKKAGRGVVGGHVHRLAAICDDAVHAGRRR